MLVIINLIVLGTLEQAILATSQIEKIIDRFLEKLITLVK